MLTVLEGYRRVRGEEFERRMERFKEILGTYDRIESFLEDEEVLTLVLQMRFIAIKEIDDDPDILRDTHKIMNDFYEDLAKRSEFVDLLPYVKNYLWPLMEESVNLMYGIQVLSAEDVELFTNISYKDFGILFSMGFGVPIDFSEFVGILKHSLQLEALILILFLLLEDKISLNPGALTKAKELFKTIVQRHYVGFRYILGRYNPPRSVSLSWDWEGTIQEDSSSVDVQHELYRWRLNSERLSG